MTTIELVKRALTAYDNDTRKNDRVSEFHPRGAKRHRNLANRSRQDETFVRQIACVAAGIRCAFLVDSVIFWKSEAGCLARHLAEHLAQLLVIYEDTSEQVFIANRGILSHRLGLVGEHTGDGDGDDGLESISFVDVSTDSPRLRQPPKSLTIALARLRCGIESLSSDDHLLCISLVDTPTEMTTVAAWMLEYPIAYVVGKGYGNCLGGLSLWLFTVGLCADDGARFDLLAFSVPRQVGDDSPDISSRANMHSLAARLQDRYQMRLSGRKEGVGGVAADAPASVPWTTTSVSVDVVTLDTVAL